MKIQTKKELHTRSIVELSKQLKDVSLDLRALRLEHEQGKVKDTRSLAAKRDEIAVIKTIIREKEDEK